MCLSWQPDIGIGSSWNVTATNVSTLDPTTPTGLLDYEAAYMFEQAAGKANANPDINAAVWYLFQGAPPLNTDAENILADAQAQTYTKGEFSNVILYAADPAGSSQDFFGVTPEPSTLMMMGTGVLGLAGLLRRKLGA